jgi:aspartyl-tRNA synthetase
MTTSPTSSGTAVSTPRSSTDHHRPNGVEEKPHGLAKITSAFKRLSGSSEAPTRGASPTGKAHARHEHHRIIKEEKEERRRSARSSLDQKRQEEDEQARMSESQEIRALYGELVHPGEIISVRAIGEEMKEGMEVTFRARIHTQRKVSAALDFLLFRDQTDTIQGVLHRNEGSAHMVKWTQRLPPESIVQVTGTLAVPREPVKSATVHNLEVTIHSIHLVRDAHDLPFHLYREEDEPVHKRLDARIVDLRHPSNQAVFRIRSKIMQAFRESLYKENFIELSTPKLQPAATESGAEVFKVNYFGRTAFLAQSPQLAKQMAISADFGRVMEVRYLLCLSVPVLINRLDQSSGLRTRMFNSSVSAICGHY